MGRSGGDLTRAIAGNMIAMAAGKAVAALLGLGTVALFTRHLGPDGFGQYRTVLAYLSLAALVADLGLYFVVLRDISRDGADRSRIVGNALALRLTAALLILIAAVFFSWLLPYDRVVKIGLLAGILGFAAMSGHWVLLALFHHRLRQWWATLSEVLGAGVLFALAWWIVQTGGGVLSAVGALVAGNVATLGTSWILARRLTPFKLRLEWAEWRRLIVAGLPLAAAVLLNVIHLRTDTVLLALMQPPAAVGLYGLAYKVLETIVVIPVTFAGLVMPLLSRYGSNDIARFRYYLSRALDAVVIGALGLVAVVVAFAGDIIGFVAGPQFVGAATPLLILTFGGAAIFCSSLFTVAATALNRQRALLWGYGSAAVLGVTTYVVLIPRWSYNGAAWGTVIAEGIVLVWSVYVVTGAVGQLPWLGRLSRAFAAAALALGTFRGLEWAGLPWIANLIAGGLAYLAYLWAFRAIPTSFVVSLFASRPSTAS